ncbi:MAG: hypothetical protein OEY22_07870 [Candidatus Bathyarchaeota archaeon]|nr:hypothetical protein [Candidatus Bathyarchaeota archaeon]MDH5787738.1 hypothetical protein [Candidatus Bathyarchaeota archaeon]
MREIPRRVNLQKPINVDKININKDYYFTDAYMIDLPLDSTPGHIWQSIFEREWKSSRHLWDRKLFVVGDRLRLVTTVDNIEGKVNWVRKVVERTNKSIDEYRLEAEARIGQIEQELKRQMLEEEELIEKVRNRLRKLTM